MRRDAKQKKQATAITNVRGLVAQTVSIMAAKIKRTTDLAKIAACASSTRCIKFRTTRAFVVLEKNAC